MRSTRACVLSHNLKSDLPVFTGTKELGREKKTNREGMLVLLSRLMIQTKLQLTGKSRLIISVEFFLSSVLRHYGAP